MIAGKTPNSISRELVRQSGVLARRCVPVVAGMWLLIGMACSDKKSAPAPAAAAPTDNATSAMFQKMKEGRPLPPPPTDEGPNSAAPGAPQAAPPLSADFQDSPECKALTDEEKQLRAEIEIHNRDVVGPASERSEAAYDAYQACQEDPGCINTLPAFQAKQGAYQAAKRAEEQAEKKTEEHETRLHEISQKMAARCNNDPL